MQLDWNIIFSALGVAVPVLLTVAGIYRKQRDDNARAFEKVGDRLTAIETKLQIDDATKAAATEAAETAAELALTKHCARMQGECPALKEHRQWASPSQVTNPGKG